VQGGRRGRAAVAREGAHAVSAHVDDGAAGEVRAAGGEVDGLDATVVPGGDDQVPELIEGDVGGVVEAVGGRVVRPQPALAPAGQDGQRPALLEPADAVVVPVGDVEPPVGRDAHVLRQVEVRLERRPAVGAVAGHARPGDGADAAARRRAAGGEVAALLAA